MNRRSFLAAAVYGAVLYVVSRMPWYSHGAVFKVTQVAPYGSGMEYSGHQGAYVYNARRCCKNCQNIQASWTPSGAVDAMFWDQELTPINQSAARMSAEIQEMERLRRSAVAKFELAV